MNTKLDIHLGSHDKERFYLLYREPRLKRNWTIWRFRYLSWEPGPFKSWSFRLYEIDETHFRGIQIYLGKLFGDHHGGKLDNTRTQMLRLGQLGGTYVEQQMGYIYTSTPSEQWAIRIKQLDKTPVISNMGGA
jgi:hypothetical protein